MQGIFVDSLEVILFLGFWRIIFSTKLHNVSDNTTKRVSNNYLCFILH